MIDDRASGCPSWGMWEGVPISLTFSRSPSVLFCHVLHHFPPHRFRASLNIPHSFLLCVSFLSRKRCSPAPRQSNFSTSTPDSALSSLRDRSLRYRLTTDAFSPPHAQSLLNEKTPCFPSPSPLLSPTRFWKTSQHLHLCCRLPSRLYTCCIAQTTL